MKYRLEFLNGQHKGRRLVPSKRELVIGRGPDCDVDLAGDDEVSHQHATIDVREDGVFIRDLNALNRVAIAGQEVEEARLATGDVLEIGRTRLQYSEIRPIVAGLPRNVGLVQLVSYGVAALVIVTQVLYLAGIFLFRSPNDYARIDPFAGNVAEKVTPKAAPVQPVAPPPKKEAARTPKTTASLPEVKVAPPEAKPSRPEAKPSPPLTQVARTTAPVKRVEPPQRVTPPKKQVDPPTAIPREPSPPRVATRAPATPLPRPRITPVPVRPPPEKQPVEVSNAATETMDTVEQDVEALRKEMAALRQRVEVLASDQPSTITAIEEEDEPPPPPPEPERTEDLLTMRARQMLRGAIKEVQANNLLEADEELGRIQFMAPDFLPAYVERAKLYEKRGMLSSAVDTWAEVLKRSPGTHLYDHAASERLRISRAIIERNRRSQPAAKSATATAPAPRRQVRILDVDREKFQASDEFDEMRLLRVSLLNEGGGPSVNGEDVEVYVIFFDMDGSTGALRPTRAVVPEEALGLEGAWPSRAERSVTAAYLVPRGFREKEKRQYGVENRYYGYVVRLFHKGKLQDEAARPDHLREEARKPAFIQKRTSRR